MKFLLTLLFMAISLNVAAIGVDEKQLSDPAQETRAQNIMKQLRCLVCQNQSIVESDAELAVDLRAIVREQV
ncbi:MAG: cytochrome c-type biogenesis protein CcmH, partial [Emcibacter sp.]|nr:cytochrome c-type biogenesis protein CcmH [Emcibacter sp.]